MISDPNKVINIEIDHQKIPVWIYGDSKNPSIIYIHGFFGGFSNYFGDLPIRHLMKNYYIVAFDLPGYGFSKNINVNSLDFISEIQNSVLKDRKTALLGISYGGLISLNYYLKNPKKVTKIIIGAMPIFSGIFNIYKPLALLTKYKNRKINMSFFKEFDILNQEILSKVKIPILLYYSKSDFVVPVAMGKRIHEMLPYSRLFITKGQNHQWIMDKINKNGFLEEVNKFFKNN